MSNDQKHKRPKFSLEFKQDAAQLVLEKGYSHQQAAEHLDDLKRKGVTDTEGTISEK
jgi:transposase-like protein